MVYLGERRLNCQGLQLEELADKVLLCKAQGFQFTKDLLEYLQTEKRTSANWTPMRLGSVLIELWLRHLVKLGPVGHV